MVHQEYLNSDFHRALREVQAQEENEPQEIEYERALREVQAQKELERRELRELRSCEARVGEV